jgi:hypothetical protein
LDLRGWKLLVAEERCIKRGFIYASPNVRMTKSKRIGWETHAARNGILLEMHTNLVGKPDGRKPFGISWSGLEDNIRMHLREIGWEVADWIHLVHDREQWRAL